MTPRPGFRELLEDHATGDVLVRLIRYAELLERWSRTHNLVRFTNRRELVRRHLLDALEGTRLMRGDGRLLDVGSGAGLPGIPLLVARERWSGLLVEPRLKRWAFLKRAIRELGLNARAVDRRYQELDDDRRFDLITARALGDHEALLEWARGRLVCGGGVALWTTIEVEDRLAREPGWRVLSWPLVGLERGRLVHCVTASTEAPSRSPTEGFCST